MDRFLSESFRRVRAELGRDVSGPKLAFDGREEEDEEKGKLNRRDRNGREVSARGGGRGRKRQGDTEGDKVDIQEGRT